MVHFGENTDKTERIPRAAGRVKGLLDVFLFVVVDIFAAICWFSNEKLLRLKENSIKRLVNTEDIQPFICK